MKWSANNRACIDVWSSLIIFEQIREHQSFKSTGKKKMAALTFFPQDASAAVINARAKSFALQLDIGFRLIHRAVYEKNKTQASAVKALASILKEKDKTVAELADIADDYYRFYKEAQ